MGGFDSRDPWLTVVGVAALTRYRDLTRPRPTLYVPFETDVRNSMIVAAVAVMLATSFAACYVPVRRAMRIDPCSLLQAE